MRSSNPRIGRPCDPTSIPRSGIRLLFATKIPRNQPNTAISRNPIRCLNTHPTPLAFPVQKHPSATTPTSQKGTPAGLPLLIWANESGRNETPYSNASSWIFIACFQYRLFQDTLQPLTKQSNEKAKDAGNSPCANSACHLIR
jgi:hypothetical protein